MNKTLVFILVLCLCVGLCACSKSENVIRVEALIDNLGAITLESEGEIEKAMNAYNSLTDKEKKSVENYAILEESVAELDKLKTEQQAEEEKKNKEIYDQAVELEKTDRKQAYELYKQLPGEYSDVAERITKLENTAYIAVPFTTDNPERFVENMNGLMVLHDEYEFTLGLDDKIELTLLLKCEECGTETMVEITVDQNEINEHGMLQKFGYANCSNRDCSTLMYLYGVNITRK